IVRSFRSFGYWPVISLLLLSRERRETIMGNAMVSDGEREGSSSPSPLLLYPIWVYIVLLLLARFVYLQPWGMAAERKRAIQGAQKKRQERFDQIKSRLNSEDGSVVERRLTIIGKSFEQLRDALQQEELTAVEVHEAYMWKALQVQDRLNCLNEVIIESFEWAREVDEKWRGKKEKPPLYGVPFSVKGNFHIKGYDCNLGLGKYVDTPMNDECTFVTHLRYLGGVPFVITTVPQALLSFVCSSAVYGTTANPHDITRGPGGSSGGEAALCAAGGTPFGIGSDLLGSLRIPANMCGLTTLKLTEARLVVTNAHGGVPGRGRLGLGFGFFTKTVKEQVLLLREVLGHPAYAALVPDSARQRLDEAATVEGRRKWRIGYFESDGWLNPVPSVVRAVRETVDKLREDGHEMVMFKVPDVEKAAGMMYKNAMPDGGKYSRFLYSNDVVDKWMKHFVMLLNVPRCLRIVASYLIQLVSPQMALVARESLGNLEDARYNQEMTDNYKRQFIEYWKALGIDALVCPSFTVTAIPHQYPSQLTPCGFATGLFNLVDFPCGSIPVGRVSKADDEGIVDESVFPVGRNPILKMMRDGCKGSEGMPLTVQVVALPLEEEICLSVMATIEKLSSYDGKLPGEHSSTKSTKSA
ncbi:faah-5, partial [Pristionchus pacificus]